jgi:hypothetical protein
MRGTALFFVGKRRNKRPADRKKTAGTNSREVDDGQELEKRVEGF